MFFPVTTSPRCRKTVGSSNDATQARAKNETRAPCSAQEHGTCSAQEEVQVRSVLDVRIWTFILHTYNWVLRTAWALANIWRSSHEENQTTNHTINHRIDLSSSTHLWLPLALNSLCQQFSQEAKSKSTYRTATQMKHLPYKLHSPKASSNVF